MNVNAICEVNSALFNLIATRSPSLASNVLGSLSEVLKPEGVELSDFAVTTGGKRLICLFGDHLLVLPALTSLVADFPGNTFGVLGVFEYSGAQYEVSGTPAYPIAKTAGTPEMFKYAKDVESGAYSDTWDALSREDKKTADPFWRTTDFNPRNYS